VARVADAVTPATALARKVRRFTDPPPFNADGNVREAA